MDRLPPVRMPTFQGGKTFAVQYRIGMKSGPMAGCTISISATNELLSQPQIREVTAPPRGFPPGRHDSSWSPLDSFAETCQRVARADARGLADILKSSEAVVPVFGSPPYSWTSLESIVAQGAGVASAVATANNVPTLLLAYSGGVILVHFVNPIVSAAGQAVAEGIGSKIRIAFGLREAAPLEAADNPELAQGGGDSNREIGS